MSGDDPMTPRRDLLPAGFHASTVLDDGRCTRVCPHGSRCTRELDHEVPHGAHNDGGGCNHRGCFCSDADVELPVAPASGKGIVLRCSWCREEQRLDLGAIYPDRAAADFYLHLMTGGWTGLPLPGIAFKKVQPDDFPGHGRGLGMSACCGTQLEGELYGYPEGPGAPQVPG